MFEECLNLIWKVVDINLGNKKLMMGIICLYWLRNICFYGIKRTMMLWGNIRIRSKISIKIMKRKRRASRRGFRKKYSFSKDSLIKKYFLLITKMEEKNNLIKKLLKDWWRLWLLPKNSNKIFKVNLTSKWVLSPKHSKMFWIIINIKAKYLLLLKLLFSKLD